MVWAETISQGAAGENAPLSPCWTCGKFHGTESALAGMPSDPLVAIEDLWRMGFYRSEAASLAHVLSMTELRKELFFRMAGRGNPERETLARELASAAGGLENAFAAAFGPQSNEFFAETTRVQGATRREFLRNMAIGAALVSLASCGQQADETTAPPAENAPTATAPPPANLEKTDLKIGFIPITCATPIVMSEPLGFYKRHGLNVQVVKMPSWAAIRDSAIAGELDAYHMLAPMPIAMTLGLGSATFGVKLASIENINGQAITVAMKYKDKVKEAADFKGFTIGVPFPYSMHNLLIRYYLAAGGLNPNQDVKIIPVPPPDSVARLSVGDMDAMLMPDPFNQRAVFEKAGFIHLLTKDLWPGHPCCAFAASDQWIEAHPNTFRAVNKAIIDGTVYANNPANRKEIATAISERQFLNQPEEVVAAVLTGEFEDGLGNQRSVPDRIGFDPYPWQSFSYWISSQLMRWDFLPKEKADHAAIGKRVFLTDLARELAKELGQNSPSEALRVEKLKFDEFDPANASAYVEQQIKDFGV
ncbi:MAG TPA: taurine ABC transporter substrate-binding protein [Cyanobacteria bacterium UBA8156]|nr:taurine ABC transporter substrate-binding protein [Cyanobacteria bacterium UBA8156]